MLANAATGPIWSNLLSHRGNLSANARWRDLALCIKDAWGVCDDRRRAIELE